MPPSFSLASDPAEREQRELTRADIRNSVIDGALLRVRPIMMTVAAIIVGLLPIMLGGGMGTGSELLFCTERTGKSCL